MSLWAAIVGASFGCYVLKLAGLSVPQRILDQPWVSRIAALLPVALLASLVLTQTFSTGRHVVVDAPSAGLVAAVIAAAPGPLAPHRGRGRSDDGRGRLDLTSASRERTSWAPHRNTSHSWEWIATTSG